jgi:hypothetical protein
VSHAVDPITFVAQVARVQTLADGGLRVVFDLPETVILEAAQLMECKRQGIALSVEIVPADEEEVHIQERKNLRKA